jgi:hypothetical protein
MLVAAQLGIAPHLIGLRTAAADGQSSWRQRKSTTKNAPEEIATANAPLMTHWLKSRRDTFETWERYLTELRSLRDSIVTRGAISRPRRWSR